jgi:hypothetical protein
MTVSQGLQSHLCCLLFVPCRLTPYLASLSTSQLKLLTIYYNRVQGKQQPLQQQPSESQF